MYSMNVSIALIATVRTTPSFVGVRIGKRSCVSAKAVRMKSDVLNLIKRRKTVLKRGHSILNYKDAE